MRRFCPTATNVSHGCGFSRAPDRRRSAPRSPGSRLSGHGLEEVVTCDGEQINVRHAGHGRNTRDVSKQGDLAERLARRHRAHDVSTDRDLDRAVHDQVIAVAVLAFGDHHRAGRTGDRLGTVGEPGDGRGAEWFEHRIVEQADDDLVRRWRPPPTIASTALPRPPSTAEAAHSPALRRQRARPRSTPVRGPRPSGSDRRACAPTNAPRSARSRRPPPSARAAAR